MAIKTGITWGVNGVSEGISKNTISSKTNTSFTAKHTSSNALAYRSIRFHPGTLLPANATLTKITANFTFSASSSSSHRAAIWPEGAGSSNYVASKGSLDTNETAVSLTVQASELTINSDGSYGLGLGGYKSVVGTFYWYFSNVSFDLEYEIPTITVTTNASPAEGGTVTGEGTYEYDSTVTLLAIPNSGYVFSHWYCVDKYGNTLTIPLPNYLLPNVIGDIHCTAMFEKVQTSKIYYGTETAKSVFDTSKNKAKSVWYDKEQIL